MYTMKPYTIQNVLVPIDFSNVALNALETAIALCKRQLATLTLLHVVENTYILFPPEAGGASSSILPELLFVANENLNELTKKIRINHELVVKHVVRTGNPADEICRWALHKETDLILMGTHGASGLREFFIGSNAYRVVKNSPCPVMTIPGSKQWKDFKNILFPIRMVPHALDKYDVIRPIIRKNSSSLTISGMVKKGDPAGLMEMKALVDSIKSKISEDSVACESEVHFCTDVAKAVLDISDQQKPDLIVITATLDKSLRDFFIGPYTQDIVNHAKYPVLSIRPEISNESLKSLMTEISDDTSKSAFESV